MEALIPIIIQLISGAAGGNIVGALFKNLSLGTVGNSLAGIVGGGLGGQILAAMSSGSLDGIVGQIAGGGVGGGILMLIIGIIKKMVAK